MKSLTPYRARGVRRFLPYLLALGMLAAWLMLMAFAPVGQAGEVTADTLIVFVVSLIAGAIGMPFIDWLKHVFKLSQIPAMLFAYAVSILIAAVAMFLTGAVGLVDLSGEAFFMAAGTVISTAGFVYKLFNAKPQTP